MSARRRTRRDGRRRGLSQNFLANAQAERVVEDADLRPGERVVEIGAGNGAITALLARRKLDVTAVELDPVWAARLRERLRGTRVRIVHADFLSFALPTRPFRVIGSLPFGRTTAILRALFDDPRVPLERADLVVQWEVACKRAAQPPTTLLSTIWAPWWVFRLERRIAADCFRPRPRVDAGVLVAERREPPLLPPAMAYHYAGFVRSRWPFHRPSAG